MKLTRLLPFLIGGAALLASCSTTGPVPEGGQPSGQPATDVVTGEAAPEARSLLPLRVPPLSSLRDTTARRLDGGWTRADWSEMPGWSTEPMDQAWVAFLRNCAGLMRPTGGSLTAPARAAPRPWHAVCAAAADASKAPDANDPAAIRRFLQQHLQPWRLDEGKGAAANTVTGYYEPLVRGSRERGGVYQWPLYAVPADLLTIDLGAVYPELAGKRVRGKLVDGRRVVPYDTRAEIAADSARQPAAIVWVDDPVDAFFLQIQGSGRVLLTDGPDKGKTLRLAYADHNGRPYASIGRWLADQGELTLAQASMQNIRAWARRNPARVQEMLNANPAMVFFREETIVDPSEGPKGAYGIPLTGQRSIAVDTRYVPLGAPVYLATTLPSSNQPLNRLVFAQDTGAAIKGAARADFYWGFGDEAGEQAGRMKQRGRMWVLWPKTAGQPAAR
ncbi:murein transglycosylase A [Kerstersia gyiorum]|uniref:peptidoglycan lytic exotransglycosylase n=1 Tax=Kerstersia gyiorum TaxID=206506 RepID=A0A171KWK8_9BURK|nr:MltA domain-containing protein [Kerstersia gyiorum]KKO73275.1 membrane protein [Kerstersia gyiorum]MCR4157531.1 MltA domain-containing protein [Kerstersia gyiorum]